MSIRKSTGSAFSKNDEKLTFGRAGRLDTNFRSRIEAGEPFIKVQRGWKELRLRFVDTITLEAIKDGKTVYTAHIRTVAADGLLPGRYLAYWDGAVQVVRLRYFSKTGGGYVETIKELTAVSGNGKQAALSLLPRDAGLALKKAIVRQRSSWTDESERLMQHGRDKRQADNKKVAAKAKAKRDAERELKAVKRERDDGDEPNGKPRTRMKN